MKCSVCENEMTCPLCADTGEQRYWEKRWRDERALNVELMAIACGPLSNAETRALARAAIAKAKDA